MHLPVRLCPVRLISRLLAADAPPLEAISPTAITESGTDRSWRLRLVPDGGRSRLVASRGTDMPPTDRSDSAAQDGAAGDSWRELEALPAAEAPEHLRRLLVPLLPGLLDAAARAAADAPPDARESWRRLVDRVA